MCSSIWAATPIAWPSPTIACFPLQMAKLLSVGAILPTTTNRSYCLYLSMSSSAASCCIYFHRVLCAFETLASWPTADVPHACCFAFTCSGHDKIHRPNKMPLPPMIPPIFGAAPSVMAECTSSKGSRPPRCNFVLHRRSSRPHETTPSNSNSSRVSPRSVPLRFAAEEIPSTTFSIRSVSNRFAPLQAFRRVGCHSRFAAQLGHNSPPLAQSIQSP